ncbi:MAG: protein kinase [Deltaproteobacteria bacterium]|nr:protein kinase [Deltaproteobacteria bacterium]
MQLPAPLGKYELLDRIATGGMAEVYLARSFGVAGFEKQLVIKRIRPEHARDPRFVSLFINEAKIVVHLNHPNIVQVYDLGKAGDSYYIAMEHLRGKDLTRLVKTLRAAGERLPVPVSVAIVAEVCRGLAHAHGRTDRSGNQLQFVHRDVSPHNIMVTFDGEVKLVDFGVARLMNTVQGHEPSRGPGHPGGGKYAYMSPEQALGIEVDHRTDLFSTGIVLWELLVGHRLFQDPDPKEKLRKVIQAEIPDPRDEGIEIGDALWVVLRRALARDRESRYPWASLLEEDLRAWLFHHGALVGAQQIAEVMHRVFPEQARRANDLDLTRMVADVERLDADPTAWDVTPPGTGTSPTPLPGRLQVPEGECKKVVVAVVDVDGLTALSCRLEPEDLFKRHYRLLRWMHQLADRYGGTVLRAVDDEVVLVFGVPRTRVDDLARALECAMELQRTVSSLTSKGLSVTMAIGVHLGEVLVTSGQRGQLRCTARGDTTRLAQRLSFAADAGQILVSDRILLAAENTFRMRRGPDLFARRGNEPRPSYVLEGRRRGLRVAGRGPWLRRGNELEVIRDALVALGGERGSAIFLVGAEGAGKSRLIEEIRELAVRRGLPFYQGRCTPWGADPPMEPFRDLVRAVIGVELDAPRAAVRERVQRLAQLGLSERDIDAIGGLIGASEGSPRAEDTWHALNRTVEGLARDGPVIFAVEDLHHLANPERNWLAQLIRASLRRPVMVLCTHRGPLPAPFGELGTTVELGSFSGADQRRLLSSLLEASDVEETLFQLVERTCEGNPLYVEEMVKYLLHQHKVVMVDGTASLVGDLDRSAMPDSIAGLISARIDALDPASKGALQLASIVGRSFSATLLGQAAGVDDPTPLVTDLASHGLINRTEPGIGDQWSFASDLVRESTLRGILGVQRRDYHRLVASAIETLNAEDLDAWAATLAHHCAKGGRHLDAARYAHRAGNILEQGQFLERALLQYQNGLRYLEHVPEDPEHWDARIQGEATLHFRTGVVSILLGNLRTGERALQLALDIASDAGIPWVEVRAHVELGRSYLQRGRIRLAGAHLTQAGANLELEDDPQLALETLEATAILAHEEGRNEDAEALWQEALKRALGDPSATARSLIGLANRHLRSGQLEQAAPLLEAALKAARDTSDRILEGRVLNNIGLLHLARQEHDEALSFFRQALQVREGIGYTQGAMVNHHNIGDAHFALKDYARAYVAFQRSRDLAQQLGWERGIALNDVYLGYIEATEGREEEGLARIERATEAARQLGDAEITTSGALLAGRWLLEHGRVDKARANLTQALQDARRYDLRLMEREIEALLAGPEPPPPEARHGEVEHP